MAKLIDVKSGKYPIPPAAEFMARCAFIAKRALPRRSRSSSAVAPAPPPPPAQANPQATRDALASLGVHRGDVLMVHSNIEAVRKLGWEPSDFIDFLLDYLGPDGTLSMPTHASLTQRDGKQVFDVRRSPSRVGLLTELFRRRTGVLRSRYPFSPAAAIGPRAADLVGDHIRSYAPHDENSPYSRLADFNGKSLCVGVHLDRITILHVAEDVMREQMPIRNFYVQKEVWVREAGSETRVVTHQRAPWLWWYLALYRWAYDMYHNGLARNATLSGITLRCAEARPAVEWMKEQVRRGRTIYPLAKWNRWLRLGDPRIASEA